MPRNGLPSGTARGGRCGAWASEPASDRPTAAGCGCWLGRCTPPARTAATHCWGCGACCCGGRPGRRRPRRVGAGQLRRRLPRSGAVAGRGRAAGRVSMRPSSAGGAVSWAAGRRRSCRVHGRRGCSVRPARPAEALFTCGRAALSAEPGHRSPPPSRAAPRCSSRTVATGPRSADRVSGNSLRASAITRHDSCHGARGEHPRGEPGTGMPMESPFCGACGARQPGESKFCVRCGAPRQAPSPRPRRRRCAGSRPRSARAAAGAAFLRAAARRAGPGVAAATPRAARPGHRGCWARWRPRHRRRRSGGAAGLRRRWLCPLGRSVRVTATGRRAGHLAAVPDVDLAGRGGRRRIGGRRRRPRRRDRLDVGPDPRRASRRRRRRGLGQQRGGLGERSTRGPGPRLRLDAVGGPWPGRAATPTPARRSGVTTTATTSPRSPTDASSRRRTRTPRTRPRSPSSTTPALSSGRLSSTTRAFATTRSCPSSTPS